MPDFHMTKPVSCFGKTRWARPTMRRKTEITLLISLAVLVAAAALALPARNKERFPIAPGPVPPPPLSAAKFRSVIRRRSTPFRFASGESAADRGDEAT